MENMFELLRKKLDEARFPITDLKQGITVNGIQQTDDAVLYERVLQIVDEIEAEYDNGWIPVEEELPKKDGMYIVATNSEHKECRVSTAFFDVKDNAFHGVGILAWQPYPKEYNVSQ